jgi:hypothetical protein
MSNSNLTASDLIEGRIALILLVGYLGFALAAHLLVGRPASALPALVALGGLVTLLVQNSLLAVSRRGDEAVPKNVESKA